MERWVLRKLSGPFQIESLYRFNKKFGAQTADALKAAAKAKKAAKAAKPN